MSSSDEYLNKTGRNPWNQVFMHNDNDEPKNEDYKISSSLKTIWSDVSDGRSFSCNINGDYSRSNFAHERFTQASPQSQTTEFVQFGNNVIAIESGAQSIQSKPGRVFGAGSDNVVTNNINPNSLKGRAITARNGCYIANFGNVGNENQPSHSTSLSGLLPHQQSQPLESFLQKVQVIVKNGFLDPKILDEPISPETFDLVQMLIFYVMEYSRARSHSNSDEIENTFYKINLIQNEIAKCQLQYVQQKRVQQEIMQSFSTLDGLLFKQQNFTGQSSSSQCGQSMASNANFNPWGNVSKTEQYDTPNQRFGQRQFDQFAQQSHASSSGKFTFLPKAKNIDKRSHSNEPHGYFSQRDGNFTTR